MAHTYGYLLQIFGNNPNIYMNAGLVEKSMVHPHTETLCQLKT